MMIRRLSVWSGVTAFLTYRSSVTALSSSSSISTNSIPFVTTLPTQQQQHLRIIRRRHRPQSFGRMTKSSNEDNEAVTLLENNNSKSINSSCKSWRQCPIPESNEDGSFFTTSPFDIVRSGDDDDDGDEGWSVEAYESSLKLYDEFKNGEDAYLREEISDALEALGNAYRLYGPHNVIGSYNGGKDAVVIFHLLRAAHAHYYHTTNTNAKEMIRPRVIYFENELEFPQVEQFLHSTIQQFDCDMLAFPQGTSFSQGLQILVQSNYPPTTTTANVDSVHPYPMAFVLGTRSSDPNAKKQTTYAPSSSYMPPFMRINPIIDFTYGHVWHFLRLFQLPYCSLYDEGYTSLGNINDTFPNPALKKNNTTANTNVKEESCAFWPAYMLRDWDQERAGRIPKKKKTTSDTNNTPTTPTISQNSSTVSLTSLPNPSQPQIPSTKNPTDISGNDSKVKKNVSFQKQNEHNDDVDNTVAANNISSDDTNNESKQEEALSLSTNDSTGGSNGKEQKSVGLIIIGDEILKGLTPDTNTHVAAQALRSHNVPLERVVVVSDDIDQIVHEIQRMQKHVDIIITSGGVGPTHDDVTIKSISKSLGSDMVYNEAMANLLLSKSKSKSNNSNNDNDTKEVTLTTAQKKMATLPTCAKLRYLDPNDDQAWPILQCANIFILPGVPQFFESKVQTLALYLSTEDIHYTNNNTFKVVLSIDEDSIVQILNNVVERHVNVSFGSYPFVDHPECKTVVTLEGRTQQGGHKRNSGRFISNIDDDSHLENENMLDDSVTNRLNTLIQFSKDEMNDYVKLALTDLVEQLPKGSVLRVDSNDSLKSV